MNATSSKRGVSAILIFLITFAAIYWGYMAGADAPTQVKISFFVGSIASLCMATAFVISARPRSVESAFGGLDRMYKVHKYLGISALLLFLVHFFTAPDDEAVVQGMTAVSEEDGELPIGPLGIFSALGFIILIILTLNRKFPYHRWFKTHQFMGLFFSLVSAHIVLVLVEGKAISIGSPPGVVLATSLATGLLAFIYKLIFYPPRERHHFELEAVHKLERATEVVLKPIADMLTFKPGQFAFITINAPGFKEAHPFTISSSPNEDRLRFTMKVLGDYTRRIRDELETGHSVEIDGPYGRFNPIEGSKRQVWIAGGVGITPFLSSMRSLGSDHGKEIILFYGVRETAEALFLDELEQIASEVGNVRIICLQSNEGEFADTELIKQTLGSGLGEWHYYLCGPRPMIDGLTSDLKKEGVAATNFHHEEFEMR